MNIHITSATQIVTDDGNHVLAMCGADLGEYRAASAVHPVASYLYIGTTAWQRVTCAPCRDRLTADGHPKLGG